MRLPRAATFDPHSPRSGSEQAPPDSHVDVPPLTEASTNFLRPWWAWTKRRRVSAYGPKTVNNDSQLQNDVFCAQARTADFCWVAIRKCCLRNSLARGPLATAASGVIFRKRDESGNTDTLRLSRLFALRLETTLCNWVYSFMYKHQARTIFSLLLALSLVRVPPAPLHISTDKDAMNVKLVFGVLCSH